MPNYFAILVAAGKGKRFGNALPKQYTLLDSQTILEHAVAPLLANPVIQKVVVVLDPEDSYWRKLSLAQHAKIMTAQGGAERMNSVLNGLAALASLVHADDFILVHDAARPYVSEKEISDLMTQVGDDSVGGILVTPVTETLKYSREGTHSEKTISRASLYRALTPQCFRYGILKAALQEAKEKNICVSDEAMALELQGCLPKLVEGNPNNKKITYQEDL